MKQTPNQFVGELNMIAKATSSKLDNKIKTRIARGKYIKYVKNNNTCNSDEQKTEKKCPKIQLQDGSFTNLIVY